MAMSASTIWEVRTTGDDTNGGGYVATGTDRSQQDAAQVDLSTAGCTSVSGSTQLVFSIYVPTSADVGNIVQVSGGANTVVGFYQITAQTATTWTLSGTSNVNNGGGAGTGITGKMGGALKTTGKLGSAWINGNTGYVKYHATNTFDVSSATQNVANGIIAAGTKRYLIGYDTTRTLINNDANRPTLLCAGISAATVLNFTSNQASVIRNIIVNGASLATMVGFGVNGKNFAINCKALNCAGTGFSAGVTLGCEADTCGTGFSTDRAFACTAHGCTTGFNTSGMAANCISYSNTGSGFDGTGFVCFSNCTAYGNGSHGFAQGDRIVAVGCLAEGNTGWGFNGTCAAIGCGAYNNTAGAFGTDPSSSQNVTNTTGSFFVNAAAGNFALNNTANQGALARAANAIGNAFPGGLSVGYADLGAVQHQDSGSSSSGGGASIIRMH